MFLLTNKIYQTNDNIKEYMKKKSHNYEIRYINEKKKKVYNIKDILFNDDGYVYRDDQLRLFRLAYCDALIKLDVKTVKEVKLKFNTELYLNNMIIAIFRSAIDMFYTNPIHLNPLNSKTVKPEQLKTIVFQYVNEYNDDNNYINTDNFDDYYNYFMIECRHIAYYKGLDYDKLFKDMGITCYYELMCMYFNVNNDTSGFIFHTYIKNNIDDMTIDLLYDCNMLYGDIRIKLDTLEKWKKINKSGIAMEIPLCLPKNIDKFKKSFTGRLVKYTMIKYNK